MTEAATFGEWLRKRRKALDLTQEELAERAGCSVWLVQKIEAGSRRASRQTAEILVDCLKVDQDLRSAFVQWARTGQSVSAVDADAYGHISPLRVTPTGVGPASTSVTVPIAPVTVPAPLSTLIGREVALAWLSELLRRDQPRLITLVGPPGIGKTRLAQELASRERANFAQGAAFVPLAPVLDPGLVPAAIAQAIGLRNTDSQSLPLVLADFLRNSEMLLVLDNLEHLLGATPIVTQLISTACRLKLVVTSREALNIRGEQQYEVPPLELPDLGSNVEMLSRSPAVELFVDRALSVESSFALTRDNAPDVAAICARLDGLPLAIELAATRSKLFSPHEILDRLHSRLSALTFGPRDLPPRHQTLRNAISWSHDLLDAQEQLLFARMAVFVGGCALPAIEAVCNPEGDLGSEVQYLVESLLNKSLLFSERVHEETRLSMLETIREYALERLEERGELSARRHYHLEHYLVLAEAADPRLNPADLATWLDRLEREHDNVRASLRWALDCGNAEAALRLGGALWVFWSERGYWNEGRRWLEEAVNLPGALESPGYARAMLGLGWIISYQGADQGPAAECTRRSLDAYRRAGDRQGVAEALTQLAWIDAYRDQAERAADLARESLGLYQELGDKYGMAVALNIIAGFALEKRDYEGARDLFTQSYKLACNLNHPGRKASSLNCLGETARYEGDWEKAEAFYTECLELCREMGSKVGIAHSLHNLGQVSLHLGNPRRASTLFRESIQICRYLEDIQGLRENLAGMAGVMLDITPGGSAFTAAMLLGAVDAATQGNDPGLAVADREQYDHTACRARLILGPVEFERAWKDGKSISVQQAIEYVLSVCVG